MSCFFQGELDVGVLREDEVFQLNKSKGNGDYGGSGSGGSDACGLIHGASNFKGPMTVLVERVVMM